MLLLWVLDSEGFAALGTYVRERREIKLDFGPVKEYSQAQKFSNFLEECTNVQTSMNYFHQTYAGLPAFSVQSLPHALYGHSEKDTL